MKTYVISLFLMLLISGHSFAGQAPQFSAPNQDGKIVHLSDFKGKYVLLYFYPKDDTSSCTKEACAFRDEFSNFSKANAVVLGVSRQDQESHQAFRAKHKLSFDLLVDSDSSLAKSFDIGTIPVLGFTKRQSVLISPTGEILKTYRDVEADQHAREVLKDIREFSSKVK